MIEARASKAILCDMGAEGSKAITGTSAVTPPTGFYFFKISFTSDTVVSAYTDSNTNNADLTSITGFPKGLSIYGKISSITLTSGDAIGYLARSE